MSDHFPFSFNPHCEKLDEKILRWAWGKGLFEDPSELERCRTQQINSFCGFLYPDFEEEKLEWVMKFFLTLFLLDDLMDVDLSEEKLQFLEEFNEEDHLTFAVDERLGRLGNQVSELFDTIGEEILPIAHREEWQRAWQLYIGSLHWEVSNKLYDKIPDLGVYKTFRPFTSGVNLAILINRSGFLDESCKCSLLEGLIARYICLSNDLDSFEKEKLLQDYHNEVILLQRTTNQDVIPWVKNDLRTVQRRILQLAEQLKAQSDSCIKWVDSLLHLVGGCVTWSKVTYRYSAHINGKPGFNH